MRTVTIVALHDGKAGHHSQAFGLAKLISQHSPFACRILSVKARPRFKVLNRPLRWLAQCLPRTWTKSLLLFYRVESRLPHADVVLSFGGNVVALNIALSRYWHCPNVLIGNTYGVDANCVSANLTALPSPQTNNITTGFALSKIDRSQCQQAAQAITHARPNTQFWCLLIGGDSAGYRYQPKDWQHLGIVMQQLAGQHGIHWLVCNSRRTEPEAMACLTEYLDNTGNASFVDYHHEKSITIEAVLGASQRIFCTEDSLSMLSEAVAMNKPVISIKPAHSSPSYVHRNIIEYLRRTDLISQYDIIQLIKYQATSLDAKIDYDEMQRTIYAAIHQKLRLDHLPALQANTPVPFNANLSAL